MKLGVRAETVYKYAEPVAFSPHEVRLFPRADRFHRVRRLDFHVNGGATVRFARDVFDNAVASCFFSERVSELRFEVEMDLELEHKDPFDFILTSDAVEMPCEYDPEMLGVLAPFLQRQTEGFLTLPGWTTPTAKDRRGTVSALVALNHALHEGIAYERREEGAARRPVDTLEQRRGACRDVAVLLAEMLRDAGLAARLVSGYLRQVDGELQHAEGSLHAWVEVFLPGAGWVGMDATNGVFCNQNFIASAVGLRPADITPISGNYLHDGKVESEMTSGLKFRAL